MYYLLTESFKSQEEKLVSLITEAVSVDKIYMLASTLEQQRTESIFVPRAPSNNRVAHYYLLVLINSVNGTNENHEQDKIENTCRSFVPITAIVLKTTQFNGWLTESHRFAYTVHKMAVLLYDNGNAQTQISNCLAGDPTNKINEGQHKDAINKVNEFIVGAELFRLRKQHKMSAFMLHQAAEHALHHILKKTTGLYINTHNIDKLIRCCSMVVFNLSNIFPRNNEANQRIFTLLQKAYIDTRYKDEFSISNEDLLTLTDRIKILQAILQQA